MLNLIQLWKKCMKITMDLLHGGYTGTDIEMSVLDQVFEEELKKVGEIANHDKVKNLLYNAYFLGRTSQFADTPHKDYDITNLINELQKNEENYLCNGN